MSNSIRVAALVMFLSVILGVGCEPEMVGAPCTPETDEGTFNTKLADTTYLVETRSVQCETSVCITQIELDKTEIQDAEEISDFEKYRNSQQKYSFCSCRCDYEGGGTDRNSDKYDDLCECPPNTHCVAVLGDEIKAAPDKIKGSYCIPDCIYEGCLEQRRRNCDGSQIKDDDPPLSKVCTPSSDSNEPWLWKCKWPCD